MVKRRRKVLFWKKKSTIEESPRGSLEVHALSFTSQIPEVRGV